MKVGTVPSHFAAETLGEFPASNVVDSHRVNHVVHEFVNFGPLEPRLSPVPHDFRIGPWNEERQIDTFLPQPPKNLGF